MTNASAWFTLAGALSGLPRSGILWVPVIVPHILSRFPSMNQKSVMWRFAARALSSGTEIFVNRRAACPKYPLNIPILAVMRGFRVGAPARSVTLPLPRTLGCYPISRRSGAQPSCGICPALPPRHICCHPDRLPQASTFGHRGSSPLTVGGRDSPGASCALRQVEVPEDQRTSTSPDPEDLDDG